MVDDILSQIAELSLDEQFRTLLHKKIMHKEGSVKRRLKKYYKDQYAKTGVMPKPLLMAAKGIFEGRKCSGRTPALDEELKRRFTEMVEASADLSDKRFIFVSRKARTITNYQCWLEEEFDSPVSIHALRRFVKASGLKRHLTNPDFGEEATPRYTFKSEPVFGLLQMDGCTACYIKIRDATGRFRKPVLIEIYDTRSRYMFELDAFFSESSRNALRLFTAFLLSVEFPMCTIKFRPDGAGGFKNLKRVIKELNLKYSTPGGFFMKPDFARPRKPKDKPHLESSHRALHNFEARVLKRYEDRIVKYVQGFSFKNKKKEPTTTTCVDIGLDELRRDGLFEVYRMERNRSLHNFSEQGWTLSWIPEKMIGEYLENADTFLFDPKIVKSLAKYGYKKVNATVSKNRTLVYGKREYYVASGAENFGRIKSAPVSISCSQSGKLFIFE
ncbi:MAG: transposase family protein, partial [Proteobacteria bacterium]|nr:transposase family protein [Pseudomonadota bacterium]